MNGLYEYLPSTPIGIGEVATTPLDFTIPLPVPRASPVKMVGQVNHKLVSVEQGAAGRLAKLDQTFDGKIANNMSISTPQCRVRMSFDFKMNGAGNTVMNVDKGMIRSSDSAGTFSGGVKIAGVKPASINIQGAMRSTLIIGK